MEWRVTGSLVAAASSCCILVLTARRFFLEHERKPARRRTSQTAPKTTTQRRPVCTMSCMVRAVCSGDGDGGVSFFRACSGRPLFSCFRSAVSGCFCLSAAGSRRRKKDETSSLRCHPTCCFHSSRTPRSSTGFSASTCRTSCSSSSSIAFSAFCSESTILRLCFSSYYNTHNTSTTSKTLASSTCTTIGRGKEGS